MLATMPGNPSPPGLGHLRPALQEALGAINMWFKRMENPFTHRMAYKYLPRQRTHTWEASPIRDIGTCSTLATLQAYTGSRDFDQALQTTLNHYSNMTKEMDGREERADVNIEPTGGAGTWEAPKFLEEANNIMISSKPWAFFDANALKEPSSIAHNAMMILALCALPEHLVDDKKATIAQIEKLAEGICRQQNPQTGKFRIYFAPSPHNNSGWELYSGEAELALATAYGTIGNEKYLQAAQRAFSAYQKEYTLGRVRSSSFIFYVNWQCQAGRALLQYQSSRCSTFAGGTAACTTATR